MDRRSTIDPHTGRHGDAEAAKDNKSACGSGGSEGSGGAGRESAHGNGTLIERVDQRGRAYS